MQYVLSTKKTDKIPKTASKQKQLPVENKFAVPQGEGAGGGMEWEVGAGRCELLYKEGTQSKVPLHSIENCIHSPIMSQEPQTITVEKLMTSPTSVFVKRLCSCF